MDRKEFLGQELGRQWVFYNGTWQHLWGLHAFYRTDIEDELKRIGSAL